MNIIYIYISEIGGVVVRPPQNSGFVSFRSCRRCKAACARETMFLPALGGRSSESALAARVVSYRVLRGPCPCPRVVLANIHLYICIYIYTYIYRYLFINGWYIQYIWYYSYLCLVLFICLYLLFIYIYIYIYIYREQQDLYIILIYIHVWDSVSRHQIPDTRSWKPYSGHQNSAQRVASSGGSLRYTVSSSLVSRLVESLRLTN